MQHCSQHRGPKGMPRAGPPKRATAGFNGAAWGRILSSVCWCLRNASTPAKEASAHMGKVQQALWMRARCVHHPAGKGSSQPGSSCLDGLEASRGVNKCSARAPACRQHAYPAATVCRAVHGVAAHHARMPCLRGKRAHARVPAAQRRATASEFAATHPAGCKGHVHVQQVGSRRATRYGKMLQNRDIP